VIRTASLLLLLLLVTLVLASEGEEATEKIADLEKRIDTEGAKALRDVLSPKRKRARNAAGGWRKGSTPEEEAKPEDEPEPEPLEKFRPKREEKDGWRRSRFRYTLHYGDYGAEATVDIHLKRMREHTVAAVFMYTNYKGQAETIGAVLASVVWPRPETKDD
jgi:hypothetical protein